MTQPEEYYCTSCGSTDVIAEADCYWDNVTQKWAGFEVVYEGSDWCEACSSQRTGAFRPISDIKTLAQIAIVKSERRTA
jgi:hypothetical protein